MFEKFSPALPLFPFAWAFLEFGHDKKGENLPFVVGDDLTLLSFQLPKKFKNLKDHSLLFSHNSRMFMLSVVLAEADASP